MPNFGIGELIIVLLIVLVLFGGGRIANIGAEMGSAIRNFRQGLQDESKPNQDNNDEQAKS